MTVWRKGVPVEVLPFALNPIRLALEGMGAKVTLRSGAPGKAGPIVTDQGGLILDCDWDGGEGLKRAAKLVDADIQALPGVVETGFFLGRAHSVFIGNADGTAEERKRIE
jgi:ribose 5-phosphate isomerase A